MKRWIVVILIVTFLAEILSRIFDQNFWLCLFGVLVIAYYAINLIEGAQEELKPKVNADTESFLHWPSLGNFDFEVVGESNYQPAIRSAAGNHGDKSPVGQYIAKLIPENDNQFDKLAVRIDINNMTVGCMSKDDARSFRRRLSAKKLGGKITTCDAEITGGYLMQDGSKANYGICLDIKPFE
jgi:hypothetical protein